MPEKILNGGFENWTDGAPDNWTIIEPLGQSALLEDIDHPHGGSRSAQLEVDEDNSAIQLYQDVTLDVTRRYVFSFYRFHDTAAQTLKVKVFDTGNHVWLKDDGTWATSETWISIANVLDMEVSFLEFLPHPDYTTYRILISSDSMALGNAYLDDVSVIESDESDIISSNTPPSDIAFDDEQSVFQFLNPLLVWALPADIVDIFELRTEDTDWGVASDKLIAQVEGGKNLFEWTEYQKWCDSQGISETDRRTITIYIKARNQAGVYSANADSVTLTVAAPDAADVALALSNKTNAISITLIKTLPAVHDLVSWEIWGGTTSDSGAATKIATQSINATTYQDLYVTLGIIYYYWIKLINESGMSSDFSIGASILHSVHSSVITFDQTPIESAPADDGAFGFLSPTGGVLELNDCDSLTGWVSDSAVSGSVIFNLDTTEVKEGTKSIKVELFRYPKRDYFEDGISEFSLGYGGAGARKYFVQSFVASQNITIKALGIRIRKYGSPTASVRFSIYEDNPIHKPGSELIGIDVPHTDIGSTYGIPPNDWVYGVFASTYSLVSGTRYWIVIYTNLAVASNYYRVQYDNLDLTTWGNNTGWLFRTSNLSDYTAQNGSMNGRLCVTGDALNKSIYTTKDSNGVTLDADLSAKTYLKSWIKSQRTGSILSHSFGEAGIGEQLFALTISNIDTWEWKSSDISGIGASSRDHVGYIGVKITNMDTDWILYLDYFIANAGEPTFMGHVSGAWENVGIGRIKNGWKDWSVNKASVDANGLPNFITASTGLSVDVAASTEAIITGKYCQLASSLNLASLTANRTAYLYLDKPSIIDLITAGGHSIVQPKYGYTFLTSPMIRSLLAFDGADGSTTITDSAGIMTWTPTGATQLDTAQKVFGTASLLGDGTTDSISAPFTRWPATWSMDIRVRWGTLPGNLTEDGIWSAGGATYGFRIGLYNQSGTYKLRIYASSNGTTNDLANALVSTWAVSANTWYNLRVVFDGATYKTYIDGTIDPNLTITSTSAITAPTTMYVMKSLANGPTLNGWVDNFFFCDHALNLGNFTPEASAWPSSCAITDEHWFDLSVMQWKRWTGSAWANVDRIFIGEAVCGASSVSSVANYALQRLWRSGVFAVAASTAYEKTHNLGVPNNFIKFLVRYGTDLYAHFFREGAPVLSAGAYSGIYVAMIPAVTSGNKHVKVQELSGTAGYADIVAETVF